MAGDHRAAVSSRTHKTLIWERTRQVQRLRHQLLAYFPAVLEAYDDLDAPDALELLGKAPEPARAARLTRAQVSAAPKRAGRRNITDRTTAILAALRSPQLGQPPAVTAADGGWRRVPPWHLGLEAVISFTGHAVFAVQPDITGNLLASLGADGFGGAHDPRLITALAGPGGWIDSLDILMAARGTGRPGATPALADRPDLVGHPRAEFAAGIRDHPRVVGYQDLRRSALAVISTGIAGLTELSFELEPGRRGTGGGARLARDVLSAVPSGQLAVAAVAPGNAASVRALLAAGFKPLGSLQLFRRAGHNPGTLTGNLAPAAGISD